MSQASESPSLIVFISYAQDSVDAASKLSDRLLESGFRVLRRDDLKTTPWFFHADLCLMFDTVDVFLLMCSTRYQEIATGEAVGHQYPIMCEVDEIEICWLTSANSYRYRHHRMIAVAPHPYADPTNVPLFMEEHSALPWQSEDEYLNLVRAIQESSLRILDLSGDY